MEMESIVYFKDIDIDHLLEVASIEEVMDQLYKSSKAIVEQTL